jgi:glycosyltransferase involved in cell wall biosynthesis
MNRIENIVIVNDAANITGGIGMVALPSALSLARRGFHVILFTSVGPVDESLKDEHLEVICLNQKDILNDPKRLRAIKQGIYNTKAKNEFENILKTLSPINTIIHFHSWSKALSNSLFSITSKYKFKIIITLHDYFFSCPNGAFYNHKAKKICNLKPMSIRCMTCNCDSRNYIQKVWRVLRQFVQNRTLWSNSAISFIVISNLNRKISENNLRNKGVKICYLRNPIELNKSRMVNVQENNEYLFIGRLSTEKGVELFCKAMEELKLHGTVLGDGYLLDQLKAKYTNIKFIGWIKHSEMVKHLQNCRALVFPSLWYETAGLVVIEMKSYGIPCIVPDQCAASEEIVDGETGYIFKSGSLDSLKNAIKKVQLADISNMQANIIQQFNPQIHSIETHTNNLLKIYNEMLQ